MIKNTIDSAKELVDKLGCTPEQKLTLQRVLSEVRSELYHYDSQVLECSARQNVYAELCEKMIARLVDRDRY